jgi:hypothetical protein
MNRPRQLLPIVESLLGATAVVLIIAACSTRDGFDPPDQLFPDAGTPDGQPCGIHCSRNLKQVLNGCEGKEEVVEQCNADQGCGNSGKCVDACTASELTKGSAGCDFWTLPPPIPTEGKGNCFAAMIANTWDRAVVITADFGSAPLDISKATYTVSRIGSDPVYTPLTGPLPPGQVAVVFLNHDPANHEHYPAFCPKTVTPALLIDSALHVTGLSQAFHIKTDAPVSAYSIYPYGGAEAYMPTATLLLPVSSWTQNYIAVAPFDFDETGKKRSLQIVANEDNTEVRINPTLEIAPGVGTAGAVQGVTQTWTLSKGQVLQFVQASLSGSPIETTKPVGVFGGADSTGILTDHYWDALQQQIPPFAQWGTEYAVVPFRPRMVSFSPDVREQVPYSIVGAVDGTMLTYEPSRPLNAPDTLASGETATFVTDQVFVVKSQDSKHPFHVNVFMTGSEYGGGNGGGATSGDPDFVNVPPVDQYLDRYVFFTDFTFPETSLTVVRRKTSAGFVPVELECAGPIDGWQPLGSSGTYEFAWVTLTSAFAPQKFPQGECGYGRQEAHSTGAFAVTVWGTGEWASYGYVGGTGLRPINDAKPVPVR